MRIGFCGAQNVGKTTLVKELAKLDFFKDFHIAVERSKYLNDLGIPLNTDSSINGQLIFIAERASELINNNLLTDRTIYDVSAYTMCSKQIKRGPKETIIESALLLSNQYDVIFYISPEGVEMEDNGVRNTDVKYREEIDQTIISLLENHPPKKLIKIKGSTEDRIKVILNEIDGINIYDK